MTSLMLAETRTAPARVAAMLEQDGHAYAALAAELRLRDPAFVVTVARGSSDHAALYLASLAGTPAASPPRCHFAGDATAPCSASSAPSRLSVAIGGQPDIVRTLEAAHTGGAVTAAIVNQPDLPLARTVAHFLPQHAGPEQSVAATKSVIATLAASARLVATWARTRPC